MLDHIMENVVHLAVHIVKRRVFIDIADHILMCAAGTVLYDEITLFREMVELFMEVINFTMWP